MQYRIIQPNGIIRWFDLEMREPHREDGPAIIYKDGTKCWCKDGEYHRLDGPAIEASDGERQWWFEGDQISCNSQEEFERILKLKAFW